MRDLDFSILKGETLVSIDGEVGERNSLFTCKSGKRYRLFHTQDCCEDVWIEDICGDVNHLLDSPILLAEAVSSATGEIKDEILDKLHGLKCTKHYESVTWTFYKISTIKGSVTIRWCGESNGYYSEEVTFKRVDNE